MNSNLFDSINQSIEAADCYVMVLFWLFEKFPETKPKREKGNVPRSWILFLFFLSQLSPWHTHTHTLSLNDFYRKSVNNKKTSQTISRFDDDDDDGSSQRYRVDIEEKKPKKEKKFTLENTNRWWTKKKSMIMSMDKIKKNEDFFSIFNQSVD